MAYFTFTLPSPCFLVGLEDVWMDGWKRRDFLETGNWAGGVTGIPDDSRVQPAQHTEDQVRVEVETGRGHLGHFRGRADGSMARRKGGSQMRRGWMAEQSHVCNGGYS